MKRKKAIILPHSISIAVMMISLLVYLCGPIPWISKWDFATIGTILLLIVYFSAFSLGYHVNAKRDLKINAEKRSSLIYSDRMMSILSVTIPLNLIINSLNAFMYGGVSNFGSLAQKVVIGITDPSLVYYTKDASSRAGSLVSWISLFYSPFMYLTNVYAIYAFKKLSKGLKLIFIVSIVVEIMRWLAVGTNKGLFDIVLLLFFEYMIFRMRFYGHEEEHTVKTRRRLRMISIFVIIMLITFFAFFCVAISSRLNGKYTESYFSTGFYSILPDNIRLFLEKFDSYFTQGYHNLTEIIRKCEFRWTFGVGNSRFFMDVFKKLFGVDLTPRTYPYQLGGYGVNPLAAWHSAYAWFASDLTFFGIIPLMYAVGKIMCSLSIEVLDEGNPVSMTLLYLLLLSVLNASCTNYVLAFTNGFMGFWTLFIIWLFQHKHASVYSGRKKLL